MLDIAGNYYIESTEDKIKGVVDKFIANLLETETELKGKQFKITKKYFHETEVPGGVPFGMNYMLQVRFEEIAR